MNKRQSKYYNNDILTLIDLFGFLLLSIVCVLVPFIIESLQYNTVFMDWFNKDAVNNGIWLSRTVENGLHIFSCNCRKSNIFRSFRCWSYQNITSKNRTIFNLFSRCCNLMM